MAAKGIPAVIRAITGFGDYKVAQNSLMMGGMSPPEIINSFGNGGFLVRHREYITDITASINFVITSLPINPGLVATFPWVSAIAQSFEQYRVRGMVFEFKSTSSNAILSGATSSALGTIIMATSYNPQTNDFVDKRTMENYQYASSNNPSKTFYHPIECARAQTPINELYVRVGSVPVGQDARLYDLGTFFIATIGQQANGGVLGELWVTFEIEFLKPKLISSLGLNILSDHWTATSYNNINYWLGAIPSPFSTLGLTLSTALGLNVISFPNTVQDGTFLFDFIWSGTSSVTVTAPVPTFFNCVNPPVLLGGVTGFVESPQSGTALVRRFNITMVVRILGPSATITFGGGASLPIGLPMTFDLIATQMEPFTSKLDDSEDDQVDSPPGLETLDERELDMLEMMRIFYSLRERRNLSTDTHTTTLTTSENPTGD